MGAVGCLFCFLFWAEKNAAPVACIRILAALSFPAAVLRSLACGMDQSGGLLFAF